MYWVRLRYCYRNWMWDVDWYWMRHRDTDVLDDWYSDRFAYFDVLGNWNSYLRTVSVFDADSTTVPGSVAVTVAIAVTIAVSVGAIVAGSIISVLNDSTLVVVVLKHRFVSSLILF